MTVITVPTTVKRALSPIKQRRFEFLEAMTVLKKQIYVTIFDQICRKRNRMTNRVFSSEESINNAKKIRKTEFF